MTYSRTLELKDRDWDGNQGVGLEHVSQPLRGLTEGEVGLGPALKSLGPAGEAEKEQQPYLRGCGLIRVPELSLGQEVRLSEF